ncbi:uncharacterized protein LOC121690233 [Alosa sapidissima]|uniref:uncharacterized protein LOC121690233 n=1 Tax=Alosa sapidissima TaxID=34773 RepID=UPI001C0919E0|nr:uncharacterized protein LOC121690233 [Alosa sapidissima]
MDLYVLTICALAVQVKSGDQKENVATGKPTSLQSTESSHASDLAVDGDPDTFTLSQVSITPSWRVDLERVYNVDAVSITNRPDCCPEKLNGAQIHIGSSKSGNPRCAVVSAVPVGGTFSYSCHGMQGRYVSVFIPGEGKQLALAEVQVFGKPAENVAIGKPTSLLSTESSHASDLAVDGDLNTFTLSQVYTTPVWRVDLEMVHRVDTVSITNRPDCCPETLNGAQIHIGSSQIGNPRCAEVSVVPVGETYNYSCHGMEGRYVNVFINGEGKQLALAEVQVFGKPAVIPTPTPAPTTPTIAPPPPPPPLTLLVSGRTVVLVREQLSWYDALLHCRSLYRDLASLHSPEKQLEVGEALLLRGANTAHVWLGLRRRMLSSVWYWMNGEEMDHSSWEGGRPRYHEIPGTSACGAAANMVQFLWSDRHCKEQLNFLCYTDDDPDYSPVQFTITYARI